MQTLRKLALAAVPLVALAWALPQDQKQDEKKDMQKKEATEAKAPKVAMLGKPAPAFALKDADGKEHDLAKLKGKRVVLEWFNPECPFVVGNHTKGSLKSFGNEVQQDGVVFLAINSGAPGKQGHGVDKNVEMAHEWKMEYPVLFDESGEVGRMYGAKTTPHMFVIDEEGVLVYKGAIDNAPRGEPAEGEPMINYVERALADLDSEGGKVKIAETAPYGCSVKYGEEKKKQDKQQM